MASGPHQIHGIVDEVLTLSDGTMAPLDYKYAEYHDTVFRTQRYQCVILRPPDQGKLWKGGQQGIRLLRKMQESLEGDNDN